MPTHSKRFAPIGVFDSGVGGLTVLERLLSDDFPELRGEEFIQVADLANIHYGSYAKTGATSFLRELVVRDVLFLLSDGYFANSAETRPSGVKTPAKIVVVGCNTAVAYGLDAVKTVLAGMGSAVRLVNIVECGARAAIRELGANDGLERGVIGVLSTPGTYASRVYPSSIRREAAGVGVVAPPEVVAAGCENLADAIQFGRHDLDAIVHYCLRELIGKLSKTCGHRRLRTVILGCSHYALALDHFHSALDDLRHDPELGPLVADDCSFIDPAVETARQCRDLLARDGLLARRSGPSKAAMFVSSPCADLPRRLIAPDGTLEDGYKYTRPQGRFILDTKFVPLREGLFDREHFKTLLGNLPHVREALARQL